MPSSTSLSLQALLRSAAGRAGFGQDRGTISGLTPAGRALYAALRAHQSGDRLIVLVVPTDADADETAADTRFFLAALEGLDDRAAAAAVLPLPSHEVDPYRGLSPHLYVASARARVLASIASGDVRVVVASAPALLPRLVAAAPAGFGRTRAEARGRSRSAAPRRASRRVWIQPRRSRRTSTASSPCAAESSTSSRPATISPSASSSPAIRSSRFAGTTRRRSDRRPPSTRSPSCRSGNASDNQGRRPTRR